MVKVMNLVVLVPFRVGPVPFPGAGNDLIQVIMLGSPAQLALDLFRGGDEPRRVTRAGRQLPCRDGMSRYPASSLDHLPDRIPVPAAQVVDQAVALAETFERQQVGGDQVR